MLIRTKFFGGFLFKRLISHLNLIPQQEVKIMKRSSVEELCSLKSKISRIKEQFLPSQKTLIKLNFTQKMLVQSFFQKHCQPFNYTKSSAIWYYLATLFQIKGGYLVKFVEAFLMRVLVNKPHVISTNDLDLYENLHPSRLNLAEGLILFNMPCAELL